MYAFNFLIASFLTASLASAVELLTDITKIQMYWGQISPYADNPEDYFGVTYAGVPDGCQIVCIFTCFCDMC